jgi:hypothetical protein
VQAPNATYVHPDDADVLKRLTILICSHREITLALLRKKVRRMTRRIIGLVGSCHP